MVKIRNKSHHRSLSTVQGGGELIEPSDTKQSQLKSEYRNPNQIETSKGRGSGVEGRGNSLVTRHSFDFLLPGTIERAHGVGDVPAQARQPAAMGGGEGVVALVRCHLAHGGAARL